MINITLNVIINKLKTHSKVIIIRNTEIVYKSKSFNICLSTKHFFNRYLHQKTQYLLEGMCSDWLNILEIYFENFY
jgi:hypothetical protein